MNCANHPETPAAAFCRACGTALCPVCERTANGTVYCEQHAPASTQPGVGFTVPPPPQPPPPQGEYSPYTTPHRIADAGVSPGLAFVLGLIPGVGAIYNGQYAKGLIHVIILGLLVSIISSDAAGGLEPLFGMLIGLWYFYMAFEAYHTALKRQRGEAVDEFSSIVPMARNTGLPVAPLVLIALGIVFLLNTMGVLRLYQILRYWPVFLIVLGVYLLYARMAGVPHPGPARREAEYER